MPTFQYRALQGDGTMAEGQLEAGGRQEAFRQMEGRGLRPISLAEKGNGNGKPAKAKAPAAKPANGEAKNKAKGSEPANAAPAASSGPSFQISFGNSNKI